MGRPFSYGESSGLLFSLRHLCLFAATLIFRCRISDGLKSAFLGVIGVRNPTPRFGARSLSVSDLRSVSPRLRGKTGLNSFFSCGFAALCLLTAKFLHTSNIETKDYEDLPLFVSFVIFCSKFRGLLCKLSINCLFFEIL